MVKLNFIKNAKKLWGKTKPVLQKIAKAGSKFMDKLKPAVDTVTDFIPKYGDTIDKVYDGVNKGLKLADKFLNKGPQASIQQPAISRFRNGGEGPGRRPQSIYSSKY